MKVELSGFEVMLKNVDERVVYGYGELVVIGAKGIISVSATPSSFKL